MAKSAVQTSKVKSWRHKFHRAMILAMVIILALLAIAYLSRHFIVKTAVEMGVRSALGMKVSVAELKLDLFPGKLEIKGLTVYNPPGFKGETLTKIPKIAAEFELLPFLSGKFHFRYLELNVNEISIIKNQQKELNLNRIQSIASAGPESPKAAPSNGKPVSFRIDQLILTVDHVKYVDYSKKGHQENRIWLGIYREKFSNLHSVHDLVRLVVVRVVMKAGLNNIGLPFRNLAAGIQHTGKSIQAGIEKSSTGVKNFFKKANPFKKK